MSINTFPLNVDEGISSGRSTAVNSYLLLGMVALSLCPLLLLFRGLDDNTLVSWRWAAAGRDTGALFLLHASAVGAAYLLSRLSPPRGPLLYAALFLIPALPSILLWSVPEVVIDASRFFTGARHLEQYGLSHFVREWGAGIDAWTDLPLPSALYGALFSMFGESRMAVQALNTALFASTVILTFLIARLLRGQEAGFLAGLLLVGTPYVFTQVPLMLGDVIAMFFLTLSAFLTISYTWSGGSRRLVMVSVGYSGALLCKYSLWPALFLLTAVVPAAKFLSCRKREVLLRGGVLVLSASLPVLALFLWRGDLILSQMSLLADYQLSGLRRWGESHLSTFVFQVHPFVVLLAGYGGWRAFRERDASFLTVAFLPVLAVVAGVRRTRYFVVLLPLLAVAAAYGLSAVGDRRLRRFAAWHVVLFSAVTSIFLYRPFLQEMSLRNLKDAAQVLNSTGQPSVEVHLSPEVRSEVNPAVAVPLLDLYTKGQMVFRYRGWPDVVDRRNNFSPFRFSWRYRNPAYYGENIGEKGAAAVVFIGGDPGEALPPGLEERTRGYRRTDFLADNGLFNFSTAVTVFLPPEDR